MYLFFQSWTEWEDVNIIFQYLLLQSILSISIGKLCQLARQLFRPFFIFYYAIFFKIVFHKIRSTSETFQIYKAITWILQQIRITET